MAFAILDDTSGHNRPDPRQRGQLLRRRSVDVDRTRLVAGEWRVGSSHRQRRFPFARNVDLLAVHQRLREVDASPDGTLREPAGGVDGPSHAAVIGESV
ncbi:MAG: hypothetical protein ACE5F6_20440, partial [Anaerolineae bacterium]